MLFNMILPGAVETARLPKEYQEVEYIQSSGTQYIDTGLSAQSDNVVYECAWTETTLESNASIFGSTNKSSSTAKWSAVLYHPSAGSVYLATAASDGLCKTSGIVANIKNTAIVTVNNGTIHFSLNGSSISASYSGSIVNGVNIGLFADLTSSGIQEYCMYTRMYYWKMWDGGVLVADFVPCYRKSDNAVGMYDIVNKEFHGNAGTGAFTAGPIVTPPQSGSNTFAYSGDYTDDRINGKGTVRLNTSGRLEITGETITVTVVIVGAGGGAGYNVGTYAGNSGGGGGNQTVEVTLEPGTYEVVIGTGGAGATGGDDNSTGGNGGDTIAFGYTSTGGKGGSGASSSTAQGGTPNGGNGVYGRGDLVSPVSLEGGSPNGGSVSEHEANSGGDGYVELTFI